MWNDKDVRVFPTSKFDFFAFSHKEKVFCIKPGKMYMYKEESWVKNGDVSSIGSKIKSFTTSPSKTSSIHLYKSYPYFAVHQNKENANLKIIPLPLSKDEVSLDSDSRYYLNANGNSFLYSNTPSIIPGSFLSLFSSQAQSKIKIESINGLSVSDSGNVLAFSTIDCFFVWFQENTAQRGIGYWFDLSSNPLFNIQIASNIPNSRIQFHGAYNQRKTFTLKQALSPNIPQNSAISHQDVSIFDNPDEGRGLICLTTVLPPSIPYNSLNVFCTIGKFDGSSISFSRNDISIPIYESEVAPNSWWTSCCRICVLVVSKSLIMLTRDLKIIQSINLQDIFPEPNPVVSDLSWSSSGKFFVITSNLGSIAAISRSGKNLKHSLCHLPDFHISPVQLLVSADSHNPYQFIVYSRKHWRILNINLDGKDNELSTYLSLSFPMGSASSFYGKAIMEIRNSVSGDFYHVAELLYNASYFQIFPLQSPLRYELLSLLIVEGNRMLEQSNDLLTFFYIRCVLRVTSVVIPAYNAILHFLKNSNRPIDEMLAYIIEDEMNNGDYLLSPSNNIESNITLSEEINEKNQINLMKPPPGYNVDLELLYNGIAKCFQNQDISILNDINCNIMFFVKFLLRYGCFKPAIGLMKHPSVYIDHIQMFQIVQNLCVNNPVLLYNSLIYFIEASPEDENELRILCSNSIVDLLKNKIIESIPTSSNPNIKLISSFVEIEHNIEVYCPLEIQECTDFCVLLEIAILSLDIKKFINYIEKNDIVSEQYKTAIVLILRLVWFVQWRYRAINDLLSLHHSTDSSLRLLGFPEFVNKNKVMKQISKTEPCHFSTEIYTHYCHSNGSIENDPAFVNFKKSMIAFLKPRSFSRVHSAVVSFYQNKHSIPQSNILSLTLLSSLVPWARCGLFQHMSGFKSSKMNISNLSFEQFSFIREHPKEIINNTENNILIEKEPISLITASSDLEVPNKKSIPPPTPNSEIKDSDSIIEVSSVEQSSSRRYKKRKRIISKAKRELVIEPLVLKKKTRKRIAYPEPPYYPNPIENAFYEPYFNHSQYHPIFSQDQFVPEMVYSQPQPFYQTFGPIWDADPSDFKLSENNTSYSVSSSCTQTKPVNNNRVTAQTQSMVEIPQHNDRANESACFTPQKPIFIITHESKAKNAVVKKIPELEELSSELSEFEMSDKQKPTKINFEPFKKDDELEKRLHKLLDDTKYNMDPPLLLESPKFEYKKTPENTKRISSEIQNSIISSKKNANAQTTVSHQQSSESGKESSGVFLETEEIVPVKKPEFYPRVVSMKQEKILSVSEIPKMSQNKPTIMVKEITNRKSENKYK